MTEISTLAAPAADDWWGRLYDEAQTDTASAPATPTTAPVPTRLPDWRKGQVVDLDTPATPAADSDGDGDGDELVDEDDQYSEFDDDGEFVEDDEDDEDDALPQPTIAARLRPAAIREYIADHHGDQHRRLRNLAYTGGAAAVGWGLGLEGRLHALLVECGHEMNDPYAAMLLGAGVLAAAVLLVDRHTRGWYRPLAWICRIPAASAALALALYTPALNR